MLRFTPSLAATLLSSWVLTSCEVVEPDEDAAPESSSSTEPGEDPPLELVEPTSSASYCGDVDGYTCWPLDAWACPSGHGCYVDYATQGAPFHCLVDQSGPGGGVGSICGAQDECDPGLGCTSPSNVPGCGATQWWEGCCSRWCHLGSTDECLRGQKCVAYFVPGGAPNECYARTGFCVDDEF